MTTVFCLHAVKSKNSSISNNLVQQKSSLNVKHFYLTHKPQIGQLSGNTPTGQSGRGNDGNEGIQLIPQNSGITGASPFDYLGLYTGGRGVMVIAVGNGHGDTSSNPGPD